jgi:hypothetical protein
MINISEIVTDIFEIHCSELYYYKARNCIILCSTELKEDYCLEKNNIIEVSRSFSEDLGKFITIKLKSHFGFEPHDIELRLYYSYSFEAPKRKERKDLFTYLHELNYNKKLEE